MSANVATFQFHLLKTTLLDNSKVVCFLSLFKSNQLVKYTVYRPVLLGWMRMLSLEVDLSTNL